VPSYPAIKRGPAVRPSTGRGSGKIYKSGSPVHPRRPVLNTYKVARKTVKLPWQPWPNQKPFGTYVPLTDLPPAKQLKLARMAYVLFKYGKTHPGLTALQLLLGMYPELQPQYPARNPKWFYYPIQESGYTYCWGRQPNCGHTITDGMSVGGGSVCINNLECATNQVYSGTQTTQLQNGQPLTGLGRRLLFGKVTNPVLLRFTLHEAWHYPTVTPPTVINPVGARVFGYPVPIVFDALPQPLPDVGYKLPPDPVFWNDNMPAPRTLSPPMHKGTPPGPRTKEGKRTGKGAGLADAAGQLGGETGDFVAALYKALPWGIQDWRKDLTIQSKAWRIYKNWTKVDLTKALYNLVQNQLEDSAFGKLGNVGKRAVRRAAAHGYWTGERGFSSGTGFRPDFRPEI